MIEKKDSVIHGKSVRTKSGFEMLGNNNNKKNQLKSGENCSNKW